jgi:hypothetical protein
MEPSKKTAIEGFKAVEYMRQERDRIGRETQDMNFIELQKYFADRRKQSMNICS